MDGNLLIGESIGSDTYGWAVVNFGGFDFLHNLLLGEVRYFGECDDGEESE